MATVGGDRAFVGYAAVASLGFGAILIYLAGSTFVLQDIYGLSPQVFGAIFGINAARVRKWCRWTKRWCSLLNNRQKCSRWMSHCSGSVS